MRHRRCFAWTFTILILLNEVVLSTYHWRISEDKKKIEAVPDSPYQLRLSGSLTDFLRQIENVRIVTESKVELNNVIQKINNRERIDNPKFEEQFRKTNIACIDSKGLSLEPASFHSSGFTAELCPEFHESYQRYTAFVKEYFGSPPDNEKRPPRCNYWFEAVKIKEVRDGSPLDLSKINIPENVFDDDAEYTMILSKFFANFAKLGPDGLKKYGLMLSSMLSHTDERVSRNAYLHMATAAYWRAQGHLSDAFTCYKTGAKIVETNDPKLAAYSSPIGKDAVYIAMSTLLTRAGFASVSHSILEEFKQNDQAPRCVQGFARAASGDASVLTDPSGDETKPQQVLRLPSYKEKNQISFSNTYKDFSHACKHISESSLEASERRGLIQFFEQKAHTISCHTELYQALEAQKENLDELVSEKNHFNDVYMKRADAHLKLNELVANAELRGYHKLMYDSVKYGHHPNRKCGAMVINRFPNSQHPVNMATLMACQLTCVEEEYEKMMDPLRKQTVKNRPPLNETLWKVAEVFPKNRAYEKTLETLGHSKVEHNLVMPRYSNKQVDESRDRPWRRADWPNSVDCQAVVSSSDPFRIETFPQVFISPENRGWIISELLTKHLSLSSSDSLPLPWFEPRCDFIDTNVTDVFSQFEATKRLLNKRLDRRNDKYAEKSLKTILVRLAERVLDENEVGARIEALIRNKIGPQWVALNLAGLYWRIQGNPHQAAKCLLGAFIDRPEESFLSIVQLTQVMIRTTGMISDAHGFLQQQLNMLAYKEPMFHYVQGRLKLLQHDVDKAIQHLKEAMDREPDDEMVFEDLLKIACSGKSTKPAISSQFPTVCCSPLVQNAVCIRPKRHSSEQCYVVDVPSGTDCTPQLVYHRCNGVYDGQSRKTADYANIVSPFLLVFNTVTKRDDVSTWMDEVEGVQTVESSELPLDHGGTVPFFAHRPSEWWENSKNEVRYVLPTKEVTSDEWEEEGESDLAVLPPKALSFLWIRDKSLMMDYDSRAPSQLPSPSMHQIRRGIAIFPPPRIATMSCNGVSKLDVLFEIAPSTWVSVTAKGEDIEKYVDLRGPMPAMASLQPVCPSMDKYESSPILGLDHIPAFALSDQFLFYKPEKALAEALKSLGSERDTIEHVAARLHAALLTSSAHKKDKQVNWLLCVLSSLYWRVVGDAENAMSCLRCALHTAPPHMRDVALVSLANVCHQAGLLNSALISAGAALTTSPRLVAIHFTLANIYASIGDYQRALNFYFSTLSLQSNFQPAKDRIRAIYCHSGQEFNF